MGVSAFGSSREGPTQPVADGFAHDQLEDRGPSAPAVPTGRAEPDCSPSSIFVERSPRQRHGRIPRLELLARSAADQSATALECLPTALSAIGSTAANNSLICSGDQLIDQWRRHVAALM